MSDFEHLSLGAEFPAASYAQWRALVERVLKGERFEERLQSKTADDLTIQPLYPRAKAEALLGARAAPRWQVMARIDHPDPAAATEQAIEELANGADGLVLVGAGALGAYGYGLPATPGTIERVLDGVQLEAGVAIELDQSPHTNELPIAFAALARRFGVAPATADIRFGLDPLGAAVFNGGFPRPWGELGPLTARLMGDLAAQGFTRALTVADGRIVHGAGGSEAQELAYVIAVAIAYLRAAETAGIALDDARRMISFRLAADADQYLTVAKFRALRSLWQRVEASCGLAPSPAFISAETAWRTMTRDDPYVNILRATIAVFAAGIGGADAITVLPFTLARGLPDHFARRLARNTSLVLLDETNVAAVADPTAGTGWSEQLTEQLCGAAWALFQEIEAAGGAAAALEQGMIQRWIKAARTTRERALAESRETLVGANEFRDAARAAIAVLDVPRTEVPRMPVAVPVEALQQIRFAAPFEAA